MGTPLHVAHHTVKPQAASPRRSAASGALRGAACARLPISRLQQTAGNRTIHRLLRASRSIQRTPQPPPKETIASETVVTSPTPRTRSTIGVGEEVALTHAPGSAAWTTTGGTLSAAKGVAVVLTAPDTAKQITVTGGTATIALTVVAPTGVFMERFGTTGVKHTKDRPNSGIELQPFLLPDTVNFSNVIYHEQNVGAVVTSPGAYACFGGVGHCKQPAGGACDDKDMADTVTAGKGTPAVVRDCVYSGDCGHKPPFVPGSITFDIPYEYKVGAGAFRAIRHVTQLSMLASDASTLASGKAGAVGVTTVAAPTLTNPASGGRRCK